MVQFAQENFSLRPGTEDDLQPILQIEKGSYPYPWSEASFKEELQKQFSNFWVLTDDKTDSKLIAYAVFWLLFDECHILNIAVHLDWRNLGAGTFLVRKIIQEAMNKGKKKVFLEVRKSNTAAINMYKKLGFFTDHIRKEFYSDKEDACFMVLYFEQKASPG